MGQPSRTTVTIDGNKFNALSTNVGIGTEHNGTGMPLMGSITCGIDVQVDINDDLNMPYGTLRALFQLANVVTREKVKEIKIEFWKDDSRSDAICSFSFNGWINHYSISSNGDANHTLSLSIQPTLSKDNVFQLDMGN